MDPSHPADYNFNEEEFSSEDLLYMFDDTLTVQILQQQCGTSSHNEELSIPDHGAPWISGLDYQTSFGHYCHDQLNRPSERPLVNSTMMYHDVHGPHPSSPYVQAPVARRQEHISQHHTHPISPSSIDRLCRWNGQCDFVFADASPSAIQRHLREIHPHDLPINPSDRTICLWRGEIRCNHSMAQSNLGRHLAESHVHSTRSHCPLCDKPFARSDVMKKHMRASCPNRPHASHGRR